MSNYIESYKEKSVTRHVILKREYAFDITKGLIQGILESVKNSRDHTKRFSTHIKEVQGFPKLKIEVTKEGYKIIIKDKYLYKS